MREEEVNPYGNLEYEGRANQQEYGSIQKEKTAMEKLDNVPENTLDEGICDSLINEIKNVCIKFSYVLIPRGAEDGANKLKNWDLWGPFFLCLLFALFIDNSDHFLAVIFSVFLGAIIVTFNLRVLGGQSSFFQSVAILGYCIVPLFIALLIVELLNFLEVRNQLITILLVAGAVIWCVFAAKTFVGIEVPEDRKFVALYPIILFYSFLGVMLVYHG